MYIVKKIESRTLAKYSALISALIALIPATVSLLIGLLAIIFDGGGYGYFNFIPFVWGVVVPIMAGIIGYIYGLVFAIIYNKLSVYYGGIEIELEKKPENASV